MSVMHIDAQPTWVSMVTSEILIYHDRNQKLHIYIPMHTTTTAIILPIAKVCIVLL